MDRSSDSFNRICAAIALAWLSLITIAFTTLRYFPCDFGQYYMGGVIARHRLWTELYPDPIPGAPTNLGTPDGSTMRPNYARLADETGADEFELFRFTQPPPAAIFFLPLGFLPFFPAYCVFMAVMVIATWAIALQAGAIHARCAGASSRWTGAIILIVALSPMSYRILRAGNISPLIGTLIGWTILSMLRNRPLATALAAGLGGTLKYATGALLPVMIAMRQWRTIVYFIAIAIFVCVGTLAITGTQPFTEFLRTVLPNMGMPNPGPENQSIEAMLLRFSQARTLVGPVNIGYRAAQLGSLAIVCLLIFRAPRRAWESPTTVCAASAAMIAWLLIFSPLLWVHYLAYAMPLWGWLIWEARQRYRLLPALSSLVLMYLTVPAPAARFLPGPLFTSHAMLGALGMLCVALWRLGELRRGNK